MKLRQRGITDCDGGSTIGSVNLMANRHMIDMEDLYVEPWPVRGGLPNRGFRAWFDHSYTNHFASAPRSEANGAVRSLAYGTAYIDGPLAGHGASLKPSQRVAGRNTICQRPHSKNPICRLLPIR